VSALVSFRTVDGSGGGGDGCCARTASGSSTAGALRLCIVSSGIAALGSATSLN